MRSRRRGMLASAALATTLVGTMFAGCSEREPGRADDPTPAPSAGTSPADDDILARTNLAGKDTKQIIDELDQTAHKPADLMASVRYDELIISDKSDPGKEKSLPIEGEFYLSIAPYLEGTHDCFYHSLTTCQGELVGEDLHVTITDSVGDVLVDDTVTTYANGFVGFWLPRDIEATVEVTHDGKTATTTITTGPDDPTCLTTMRLT